MAHNQFVKKSVAIALTMLLSGCMAGPDYVKPEIPAPDKWHQTLKGDVSEGSMRMTAWWEQLNDPTLRTLIQKLTLNNHDLKIAAASLREAQAQLGVTRTLLYPTVDLEASAIQARESESLEPLTGGNEVDVLNGSIAGSWELDLWGRIRRNIESARASEDAAVEAYRDTLVVLYAELATRYVDLRTFQQRLDVAQKNVVAQQKTLDIVVKRVEAELSPQLDIHRATQNLASSEATIPQLKRSVELTKNVITVLCGEMPGVLDEMLKEARPIPMFEKNIQIAIPAETLRQRPDIRQAERELASRHARIGATKAQLYPTFSLTGSFGSGVIGGGFFDANNRFWSFGPGMLINLFDRRSITRQITIEEARTAQALAQYEKNMLEAVQDVETSLITYATEKERTAHLQRAVDASKIAVGQTKILYDSGLTDFLDVLDSERSLLANEDSLVESQGTQVTSLISLYRAFGGGWQNVTIPYTTMMQSENK